MVAAIGGLVLGHIVWLLGISLATGSSSVNTAVLIVSAVLLIAAGYTAHRAWRSYQDGQLTRAAFLGGLVVSPVLFTVIVLGVTYL